MFLVELFEKTKTKVIMLTDCKVNIFSWFSKRFFHFFEYGMKNFSSDIFSDLSFHLLTQIYVIKCSVYFHLTCNSHVIPLQIPCKSHFSPILRSGFEAEEKRRISGLEVYEKLKVKNEKYEF